MATILDGKKIRDRLVGKMAKDVGAFKLKPTLAIFQIGEREDSSAYIKQKKLFAEKIGARVLHEQYPESVTEDEIRAGIKKFNADPHVHGIIVQVPLPNHLDKNKLLEAIDPRKDVDGLTSANLKLLWENDPRGIVPATSRGIVTLLGEYEIPIAGKHAVVVGRSSLVGKPAALALLNRNATVTVAHKHSRNLAEITRAADILIVAIGNPRFITADHVKKGATVIDVGINVGEKRLEEEISGKEISRKLVGDVDFESVEALAGAISPVPGGVGPMTVLSLFQNLIEAFKKMS